MNRFGLRRVVVSALVIILAGMIGCIFMQSTWQLFLFWGVLTGIGIGIGTGLTATILGATVATRWFAQRRGLVTGVLSASSATGQLIFLPALASITKTHGWQATLVVACVATGAAIVLVLLLMRDNPAAVGLAAYGETAAPAASAAPPPHRRCCHCCTRRLMFSSNARRYRSSGCCFSPSLSAGPAPTV
jgi:MFS family permease